MYSFSDIIGHDTIKEHLLGALRENKLSHAYIFAGEDGSGKMMLANRFAAALECSDEHERPCGSCISCMQAESGNHPDIIYVTHEKKMITVDDIRTRLVNDITIKPYSGQYKVYIIDEAEKMNEAAQNALLKTLEEPPEYAVILLLTTNTGAFLQTILSRCVILTLKPVKDSLIRDYLMARFRLPDYMAGLCASFSGGCIGKAIRYAQDQDFAVTRDETLRFAKNARHMTMSAGADFFDSLSSRCADTAAKELVFSDFFNLLNIWYRDVLMYKSTGDLNRLIFSSDTAEIREQARDYSYQRLADIIDAHTQARERLSSNLSYEASMQLLLQHIKN